MIQLSRAGWNNVIIYSMLIMIFLFNGLHHKLISSDDPQAFQSLFPEQAFILTLSYPKVTFERIGTSWRAKFNEPAHEYPITIDKIEQVITHWQTSESKLENDTAPLNAQLQQNGALYTVTVWFAGQPSAAVFELIELNKQFYLFDRNQQRWLIITPAQYSHLFLAISE